MKRRNKGQMTIWIIVALIIFIMIIILFIFLKPNIKSTTQETPNPEPAIDACVKQAVDAAVNIMLPNGGFITPKNTVPHNNIKVEYLCENIGYFKPCINQHPLLINEMEQEIVNTITLQVDACFDSVKSDFESEKYSIMMDEMSISVRMKPGVIEVETLRNISATKNEQTIYFSEFNSKVSSSAYDLARIAQEIADQEAKYCYFEYVGYHILYPRYKITVTKYSDLTKVYTIKDTQTNKVMNIAIRGCAIPAGL
jgi:hypothetical protein